jgi:hypothetical protein
MVSISTLVKMARPAALSSPAGGTAAVAMISSRRFHRRGFIMALRLTLPTKNIFCLSTLCAIIAFALYLLGVLGIIGAEIPTLAVAFWVAMLSWGLMTVGVALKGV